MQRLQLHMLKLGVARNITSSFNRLRCLPTKRQRQRGILNIRNMQSMPKSVPAGLPKPETSYPPLQVTLPQSPVAP